MAAAKTPDQLSAQHRISDFLHAELLHTLGAYRLAVDKLTALHATVDASGPEALRQVIDIATSCNKHLLDQLHHPSSSDIEPAARARHPLPHDEVRDPTSTALLLRISDFYSAVATALALHLPTMTEAKSTTGETDGHKLGKLLAVIHDPQRRGSLPKDHEAFLVQGRLDRALHRLREVNELLPLDRRTSQRGHQTICGEGDLRVCGEILNDHMGAAGPFDPLHRVVLESLSDAHMRMHEAENMRSRSFGTMFTSIPATHLAMETALRRSIVLNTFVYVVGRSMPWIFAGNGEECADVTGDYDNCCEALTPTYCVWTGNQLSLIALHRRAYTWWTLGDRDRAYRDFYKLTRLTRDLRERVKRRAVRVPGTMTLIDGLTAIAEYHIGRIYRGQHAHRVAIRYFDRASLHLKGWEQHNEIGPLLRNSRWRLDLFISQGKASYELGRVKKSLLCYSRAWEAFLRLVESESRATANVEVVTDLIKWLAPIEDDPELSKTDLTRRIEPLVAQFETVYGPAHLRLIAADIMMRLGHLLFILRLPPSDWPNGIESEELPPRPDHALARRCLLQAASLDPTSTLIAADLLKVRYDANEPLWYRQPDSDPPMANINEQWPSGSGRFEAAARIIEYILQQWLAAAPANAATNDRNRKPPVYAEIARELLGSFLGHTDSSNVKLAQVYRYLMQESRGLARDTEAESPTIDIVCLRRYSSFFPFLPRPAAFRAPGGGYLVQVRESGEQAKSFGVAVDPGPDFLDNLFRCGYTLADIHMIVLTHDHADHTASVDALLALMGIRARLGDETFNEDKQLAIIGNESVVRRYGFYNLDHPVKIDDDGMATKRKDTVSVMSFEEFYSISRLKGKKRRDAVMNARILLEPKSLCIEPINTIDHFDANGYLSQGFVLSMGHGTDRSSVLFTGDTGRFPTNLKDNIDPDGRRHYFAQGTRTLKEAAATADVVVAHLSSVPLRELRELAGLTASGDDLAEVASEFTELWETAVRQLGPAGESQAQPVTEPGTEGSAQTRFLLEQLQFAFRSTAVDDRYYLSASPLSPLEHVKEQSEKHLYLTGLLELAQHMACTRPTNQPPLLLIGELREELGTFRTRIASRITESVFRCPADGSMSNGEPRDKDPKIGTALTADIGLRVRLSRPYAGIVEQPSGAAGEPPLPPEASVLCSTCDLDNDLSASERFHAPRHIREVCVKGENEGVFYNCLLHDPGHQPEQPWVESVERYDPFGD